MISFKQYLEEARMAPLYHGTRLQTAKKIIKDNLLRGSSHNELLGSKAVSLTRNFVFALNWGGGTIDDGALVFEFDQQRLNQRYKITPFNYFGVKRSWSDVAGRPARFYPASKTYLGGKDFEFSNQFEESVLGPIKNVMSYVTKIHVYDEDHIPEEVLEYPHVEVWSYKTRKRIR